MCICHYPVYWVYIFHIILTPVYVEVTYDGGKKYRGPAHFSRHSIRFIDPDTGENHVVSDYSYKYIDKE